MKSHDDEDNWAELADALGIDTPATQARKQAPEPQTPPPLPADVFGFGDDLPDASDTESDTMIEPLLATDPAGGDSAGEEPAGEEGDRKRKRRRRRRRKPGPGEPVVAEAETETDDEGNDSPSDAEAEVEAPENPAEPMLAAVGISDDPTPDAVRDLISNWNVPSWQDIVSGLYRPGGGDR